jgi:Arc/MetJ family transcription regulator
MSRTNIDIDDDLMTEAMRITGQKTKKGAVEEAMRRLRRASIMRDLIERSRGIGWDGDLETMRTDLDDSSAQSVGR